MERETKRKEENDQMITRLQEVLSKDTKSETEKESLKKYFLSKQQELNESLILEQNGIIQNLQLKCSKYENEFKNVGNQDGKKGSSMLLLNDLCIEIFNY